MPLTRPQRLPSGQPPPMRRPHSCCFPFTETPPQTVPVQPALSAIHLCRGAHACGELLLCSEIGRGDADAGAHLRGRGGIRYIYHLENDQKQLVESTHTEVRAERSFTLLEDVNCPVVLAEQCFVTNADDVERFGSEQGCKRTARIYYEAICAYFGTTPLPDANQ